MNEFPEMRWFTCTPVDFDGGPDFFTRDSGLLCRGFQSLGIESRAVMPGERRTGDEADLIRTDYRDLESSDWWKAHGVDGVVLYAWGRPAFRKVAKAIRDAGIFLVLNQDNGGAVSPLAGFREWLREQWILTGQGRDAAALFRFSVAATKGLTVGLAVTDSLRASHLRCGNVIACVSPRAAERYRKLCGIYGGDDLSQRVALVPHAVESRFRFAGVEKQRQIVCIGRWDDAVQKRPQLLMDTVAALLDEVGDVSFVIVGNTTQEILGWHQSLAPTQRERVAIKGKMSRDELARTLAASQVFYSPSAYESFGIAAAEALCAGCSVVATSSVSMAAFEWFASESSGTLTSQDVPSGHMAALMDELSYWKAGDRDPSRISGVWCDRLLADKVAGSIIEIRRDHPSSH